MRDVAPIIVPWIVVSLALFALLDWDESRLSPEALEDAWPPATRTLAIVYLGVLAIPIHFWRTRARRLVEPGVLMAARLVVGGTLSAFLGRAPSIFCEIWMYFLALAPTLGVAIVVNWPLEQAVEAFPEWALGWMTGASIAGFTAAMLWRSRKGRWWRIERPVLAVSSSLLRW